MAATSLDLSQIKTDALSAASTFRTLIGLGTLATQSPTGTPSASTFLRGDFSWQTIDLSGYQPLNSDLTAIAALATTSFGRGLLTESSASTARTTLGLGTLATQNGTISDYLTTATAASTYLPLAGGTLTGLLTTPRITLSGNVSAAAWTTTGIGIGHSARTLTDTSSSGTVATAYTNVLGGNTIAASNSTTFTDYASLQIGQPTAGTNVTFTNRWALDLGGALRSAGYSLTGTQSQSLVDLSGTWNTTGIPTLIKANVTDTASNASSLLMDLQVGGSSRFKVDKSGKILVAGQNNATIEGDVNGVYLGGTTNSRFRLDQVRLGTSTYLGWGGVPSGTPDLLLYRDAAQTFAQRNGTNAQTFRVYNTFTDASNYERGKLEWSSNVLRIGTEKAGTGSARALELQTDGVTRASIPTTGGFVVGTAALATNATTEFLYVPTCAGTPTGTPTAQTGTAPIVVDTTNNKLYFYSGGAWRDAGP